MVDSSEAEILISDRIYFLELFKHPLNLHESAVKLETTDSVILPIENSAQMTALEQPQPDVVADGTAQPLLAANHCRKSCGQFSRSGAAGYVEGL